MQYSECKDSPRETIFTFTLSLQTFLKAE